MCDFCFKSLGRLHALVRRVSRGDYLDWSNHLLKKLANCTKKYGLGIVMDQCMGIPLPAQGFIRWLANNATTDGAG